MYNVHEETQVLITGGGLTGLCASLFLSHWGVDSILVERHPGTSPQPKARRINLRTMELFRQIGADGRVTEAAAALAEFQGMAAGPTLAEAAPLPFTIPGGMPRWDEISPSTSVLCAQDILEPVLQDLAAARGGDLRFGTEALDTAEDADGVTATVRGPGARAGRIRAEYLIAADGPRSPVRERLGIACRGRGTLGRAVNVYFRADLADLVRGREFNLCQIENPQNPGAFTSINGTDRWIFSMAAGPDRTPAEWAAVVRSALGSPGVAVEILSVLPWEPGMFVADRFSQGRAFLAGDAAHVMPPYAALGANTGIQDVHNLAWKLALVLAGTAAPALLDSYHRERYPAAWFAADQSSIRRANLRQIQTTSTDGTPLAHPLALILGGQYAAGAVIGDGSVAATDDLDLGGQPGTRLPHHWLGPGRSTLDLVGPGLTLLTGPAGARWCSAGADPSQPPRPATAGLGQPGQAIGRPAAPAVHRVDLPGSGWPASAGIAEAGALLVRPDHIVAWRCPAPPADPGPVLEQAIARILGR